MAAHFDAEAPNYYESRTHYAIIRKIAKLSEGEDVDVNNNWRFCAVGNIKLQHTDENGTVFYGSKAFSGRTKVYMDDRTWGLNDGQISVIGLNRFGRYVIESVPVDLIENVRAQRVFKPKVLEIINHLEILEGWPWRGRTAEDRKAVKRFVEMWNREG